MFLVRMWGWPAQPTENMKYQDRHPSMPRVPQGLMASGSSVMIRVEVPARPPSTTLSVVRNTRTPATAMITPCTRSV